MSRPALRSERNSERKRIEAELQKFVEMFGHIRNVSNRYAPSPLNNTGALRAKLSKVQTIAKQQSAANHTNKRLHAVHVMPQRLSTVRGDDDRDARLQAALQDAALRRAKFRAARLIANRQRYRQRPRGIVKRSSKSASV